MWLSSLLIWSVRNVTFYYTVLCCHGGSFRNITFYYTVFVLILSVIQKLYVLLHCFCFDIECHPETLRFITRFSFDIERHPEILRFITLFLFWHWASSRNATFYYTVFVLTLSVIQKCYVLLHGFCFGIERHPETLRFITRFLFWHWASSRNVTFYYTVFV